MSPVAVSADRRFHRAHVKPARKRGPIRKLSWPLLKYTVLVAVVAIAAYRGSAGVAHAPAFRIDDIVVAGNRRLPTAAVLAALDGLRGGNIVSTDLDAWRDRLLASPWVRDATFRRSLPSTIEVVISEREPLGIGRMGGELYLVDERGAVIDGYGPQYADFDLPIIDGLVTAGDPGGPVDDVRGDLAARLILSLRSKPNIARRLSQVDVADSHNASVILDGDRAVIHVGDDRFLERLESYLDLSDALRARVADIDYVDLRFDDRIYVRPAGKSGRDAVKFRGDNGPARVTRAAAAKR